MGDGYEDAWVFGYSPPVYRVPFDEAEHWSAGIPARTYPSGSRSGLSRSIPGQASPMRTQTEVQASRTCHGTDEKTAGKDARGPESNPLRNPGRVKAGSRGGHALG